MESPSESPKSQERNDSSPGSGGSSKGSKHVIDTAAPFESVKDAVSKFGGRVDWKSRRTQSFERSKLEDVFGKPDTAEELETTKKLMEDLKVNLEQVEKDELEVKEEAELVILKIKAIEEDIVHEASIEAKAKLEVERANHAGVVSELEFVKDELNSVQREYEFMVNGRDMALINAEEAVAASKQIEKAVEDLTAELVATKESLNSARAAHLEAEEQRSEALLDKESHKLKMELEQAEEELERLNQQVLSARVLKSKLDASSSLLHDLKAELESYMESKVKEESNEDRKKELEEVKLSIEKATSEVNTLKEASMSLKAKLEQEKEILITLKESQENASEAVKSLQAELEKSRSTLAFLQMKEDEAKELMVELPQKLQKAQEEADEAKSLALEAKLELLEAQEEAEKAKARFEALESRLLAAQKEIEAANVSEKLAKEAITALERSESGKSNNKNDSDSSSLVTITLDEYHELSKRAFKAEEQANVRVAAANSQIEIAKESEQRSLEKLEELDEELSVRKESLKIASENAEKAKEGKLALENELRTRKAEQEKQSKATELKVLTSVTVKGSLNSKEKVASKEAENGNASDAKTKKKKKKSLFPSKVVMFFAKRKTHPTK